MATHRLAELNKSQYEVGSLRKALGILSSFTTQSPTWSLSALSRSLGIPKSTAHNLVRTLESFDFLHQTVDKRFTLGPRIYELGLVYSQSTELLARALPVLRQLAADTKETAKLAVLSERQVLVVAGIESTHQLHTRGDVGGRWALHSTSLGKAILAGMDWPRVRELLGRGRLQAFTPKTVTSYERLEAALKEIRERGYALDWEENEPGVHCIAAAVTDASQQPIASVSISGPAVRITKETVPAIAERVVAAAEQISNSFVHTARRAARA